ncbi:SlyX family protein [Reinekea blandensis]|uniref:SlyX protein n=1 Tax=Reinekea blandensis MED297 TaxID=314283 RepID=A4BC10_9GAMM|nr:SlyX family protein [Reinekea blandensis]EAR10495.1 hypothetical protein MED297_01700 [Reinekea sp. MED297] [Reinekea blandensis MED297]
MTDPDRLTDLESRLMHLDDTVEQLNSIIVEQQKAIARLEKTLRKITEEHVEMKEQMAPDIVDSRPPHY